jgi:hypothetical protein
MCQSLVIEVFKVKVKVTLRLTVSQYVFVSSPNLGHLTRIFFPLKVTVLSFRGALSDESRVYHVSVFVIEVYHSLVYLQQYLHLN